MDANVTCYYMYIPVVIGQETNKSTSFEYFLHIREICFKISFFQETDMIDDNFQCNLKKKFVTVIVIFSKVFKK